MVLNAANKVFQFKFTIPYDQYQNMMVHLKLLVLQTCFGPVIVRLVLLVYKCCLFLSKYLSNIRLNLSTKLEKKNRSVNTYNHIFLARSILKEWTVTEAPFARQIGWVWFTSFVVNVVWSVSTESIVDVTMVVSVRCVFVVLSPPNLSINSSIFCTVIGWSSFGLSWRSFVLSTPNLSSNSPIFCTDIGWSSFGLSWRSTHL